MLTTRRYNFIEVEEPDCALLNIDNKHDQQAAFTDFFTTQASYPSFINKRNEQAVTLTDVAFKYRAGVLKMTKAKNRLMYADLLCRLPSSSPETKPAAISCRASLSLSRCPSPLKRQTVKLVQKGCYSLIVDVNTALPAIPQIMLSTSPCYSENILRQKASRVSPHQRRSLTRENL